MASRIASSLAPREKVKPVKAADYLAWIRTLPCVVTEMYGVEAAHLSAPSTRWGHAGRGKAQKASDRWALPLKPYMHRKQHMDGEEQFWRQAGIDPYPIALALWGIWSEQTNMDERAKQVLREKGNEQENN